MQISQLFSLVLFLSATSLRTQSQVVTSGSPAQRLAWKLSGVPSQPGPPINSYYDQPPGLAQYGADGAQRNRATVLVTLGRLAACGTCLTFTCPVFSS